MTSASVTRESVWAEHEAAIRRFEGAWGDGRPDVADFLAGVVRDRTALLIELVQVDLEFRYRAGERPRVEEYLDRFPELAAGGAVRVLLGGELALRDRHGPPYTADEIAARFPHLAGRLDTLLSPAHSPDRTRSPVGGGTHLVTERPTLPGYVVGEQLGRGGMGVVYRAVQASPARTVAVKTLLAVPDARTAARFRREAEAMARLDHPHIVPVYEVGEWASGPDRLPYFTMKWYAGGSLDSAACGPGTPPTDHAKVVETIARAVHHAHQRGVLHRDLKPSNILLDDAGQPAVADFGLAGWFDPDAPELLSRSVVGTPAFMAPEQVHDPSGVTTATDVYGLGAILYHRLTGRPPTPPAHFAAGRFGPSAPADRPRAVNPAVPLDLETVCLKCLEPDPRNRYPSAAEVADDLARWRNGDSITARRPGPGERLWRAVRRHPVVSGLIAVTAVALVLTFITLTVSVDRIRQKEAETAAALDREQGLLYLERVGSVGRLYQSNHLVQAWHTLEQCPAERRGWEWRYLNTLRRNTGGIKYELDECEHPDFAVMSVAFLPDDRVVTAHRNGNVYVWATPTRFTKLPATGTAVRTHPTRNLLAVRGAKQVTVVDADTQRELFTAPGGGWFDFTPNGERLAVADKSVVTLYQLDTGKAAAELKGHDDTVSAGAFSPDGNTLYTGSADRSVAVWDVAERRVKARWKRELPVVGLGLTPDGKTLIESLPMKVHLTDTGTGTPRPVHGVTGSRPVFLPTFDPTAFVSIASTGEVALRTAEGDTVRVYRGHLGLIYAAGVSRDGRRLVTGGEDNTARVWDLAATPEYATLATPPYPHAAAVLSADGRRLAVVNRNVHDRRDPDVLVLDADTGRTVYRVKGVGDAAFDPRGRWLATGRADGTVVVRDATDGREVKTLDAGAKAPVRILFAPDGTKLAAAEMLGRVRVWDTATWEKVEYTPQESVISFAWSPDGTRLAVADGGMVYLWHPATDAVGVWLSPAEVPLVCAFSPDGRTVAVAGRGRSLELFDADTGQRRCECVGNPSVVNGLAFHPDGTRLASVGVHGMVGVWDTATGQEVLALNGGADLFGVGWSPDGTRLYAAGDTVRRWSAPE